MNAQNNPQPTQSTPNPKQYPKSKPSVGSLFAGIGGFDLGFENAGFYTSWQVEIDPICKAVLSDRFPHATQFDDVRNCLPKIQALPNGGSVDVMSPWQANEQDFTDSGQACSLMLSVLSKQLSQDLSCLKMSQVSSIPTMAKTYKQSLKRLPNAGMWDFGECWTAVISESPKNAVEYSWLQVLENTHHLALWLTWGQWNAFLARLNRNRAGRTHTIRYWQGSAHPPSTSIVLISSLCQMDGIRWLSGSERLSMMGFAKDWMRPTLVRLGLRETPSVRKSHSLSQAT
ncbi:DNA cytosine methyltransferase [Moraxella nasicaprae]|uniref:DNA cytosine methyltransferase n=1 Tax=Moraxella nasicaprae TaxID=2904122 RepID=A0ABY6F431_9GAMM|nr:DNA cytosine methyltransferase [Moraxella nasicaprae]UXZ04866.1 DNA cytosine methyltransferase [Moraxella nasicaprae]